VFNASVCRTPEISCERSVCSTLVSFISLFDGVVVQATLADESARESEEPFREPDGVRQAFLLSPTWPRARSGAETRSPHDADSLVKLRWSQMIGEGAGIETATRDVEKQ
jgi:hypothetical protein